MSSLVQSGNISTAGRDIINNISVNGHQNNTPSLASERNDVMKWLADIASVNHYEIQSEAYAKIAPNTASWILREKKFVAWISKEGGTFWGVGMPGAGKTVLSSFVIEHLQERIKNQENSELVIFAFARFNKELTITKILATLLAQLARNSSSALSYIYEKLYTPCQEEKIMPAEAKLITHLQTIVPLLHSRLFIVIDALDEFGDGVREHLVNVLLSLKQSVFLTSRELSLTSIEAPDIRIRAPDEHFKNFIAFELVRRPNLWSLLEHRKEVLEQAIQKIISRSDGMFLIAALQISSLEGIINIKKLRKAIEDLPTGLADMYALTLERIMSQSQEESTLACRALLWVTYAVDNHEFEISELLEALMVEPDSTELDPDERTTERTLVSVCCGLLMVERERKHARLIHYTTYDFFRSYREGLFTQPHTFAATICGLYLQHAQIFAFKPETLVKLMEREKRLRMPEVIVWPFGVYAFSHLGDHISRTTIEENGELPPRIYDLLTKNLPLQLYSRGIGIGMPIDYGGISHFSALHGILSTFTTIPSCFFEKSEHGYTPLVHACIGGHVPVVERLIGLELDANTENIQGNSALHLASKHLQEPIVRLLFGSPGLKIDVNAKNNDGSTALDLAIASGNKHWEKSLAVVRSLLDSPGINVNVTNGSGKTALVTACENGANAIVQRLLECPAIDVNVRDHYGFTALSYASFGGHVLGVERLLDVSGVDVNVWNDTMDPTQCHSSGFETGEYEIHYVTASLFPEGNRLHLGAPTHKAYKKELIRSQSGPGFNIHSPKLYHNTPLHLASMAGREAVVHRLLSHPDIRINARNSCRNTALHHASMNGYEHVVQLLLDGANIDVNAQNTHQNTALHFASLRGHEKVVRTLLRSSKINVNAQNRDGRTAAHLAAMRYQHSVGKLLREFGINIDIKDKDGYQVC